MGLWNAEAVYCRLVAQIMDLELVAHYLDDNLIHTVDIGEHLDSVERLLQAHTDTIIKLKPSKTIFFKRKLIF